MFALLDEFGVVGMILALLMIWVTFTKSPDEEE